jgi:hypothetical protein
MAMMMVVAMVVATMSSARVGQSRERLVVVYETPVPGTPTVSRVPRGPMVKRAPRGPMEMLGPDFDQLMETPGRSLILR